MATPSAKEESNVAVRRISTFLRFLSSDTRAIPKPGSSAAVTVNGAHLDLVLLPCCLADGGIQGLRWYWGKLRIDKDGDIADEFFDDISLGEIHLTVNYKDTFFLDSCMVDQII